MRGEAEVGDGVHRVGRGAAVAEGEQLPARVEAGAQAPRPRPTRASARFGERLRAQARRSRPPSSGPSAARRASDGIEVVLGLARGTGRGSSPRRRHGAPRVTTRERVLVVEEDVDELPERGGRASRPAPAVRTGRRPAARSSHSAPTRPNPIVRQPRSRASRALPRLRVVGAEPDHDVVVPLRSGRPGASDRSGAEADRGQRPLADDHRMDELDRDVVRVRACLRRARRRRAAARRARSAPPCSGRAARSAPASPSKKRSLAPCAARGAPRRLRRAHRRDGHVGSRPLTGRSAREPVAPRRRPPRRCAR